MFEFLFKYPIPVFTKGKLVLLGAWPGWVLPVLVVASAAGLGWLIRTQLSEASPLLRTWRGAVVWALQAAFAALVLLLLWRPAMTISELRSQQNIIAVVVDDSRSMGIADSGADGQTRREDAAVKDLQDGVLAGLKKKFQVRLYRLDGKIARIDKPAGADAGKDTKALTPEEFQGSAPATHIGDGLKQLATETSDLPVGAVVLLSDGSENAGGIDNDAIAALRNRRLPVHTIGFGQMHARHDIEIDDAVLTARTMANARVSATVSLHQHGYAGQKTMLIVKDGDKALASRDITLAPDGVVQAEPIFFNAGPAGVKSVAFVVSTLGGEESTANNAVTRLLDVNGDRRRILYVEGEPRWEYKFIRRAAEDDAQVQVVSMLRTTENKIYRQGISDPKELADGFPSRAEDLFGYDALMIGSVEAGYFTPAQQELIREFVDRRGGGLLFMGGRFALSDGGWGSSGDADLLPTFLPAGKDTFHREPATAALTAAGAASSITRLIDDPTKNAARWKTLPYLNDFQDPGNPKPGATVLAEMHANRTMPLLVTQNYGRGRTAILATSGTWRWQMSSQLGDPSHDLFWQQMLRWLSVDSPGRVTASMPAQTLMDDGQVHLTAQVRDAEYNPAPDAHVTAHILGPDNASALVDMAPVPNQPGTFEADWTANKPGSYGAEVVADRDKDELGKDVLPFRRSDGVAENFHTEQDRALLEKLSADTGGRYWPESELSKLPNEISYSEAGISVRDTKELWNMPIVFLVLLALAAAEWLLRRKWGVV